MSYSESSATALRNTLYNEWSLADPLEKVPISSPEEGRQYLYFFDRAEIIGNERPKSITVEKIDHDTDENAIISPTFSEEFDVYDLTLNYTVTAVNASNFTDDLTAMDNMAAETLRILATVYNPTTSPPTGIYFERRDDWRNEDTILGEQLKLVRKLRITLSRIVANTDTTYQGFGGTLVFDTSESEGDNTPGSDYTYIGISDVTISEGWGQNIRLTRDKTLGEGVPQTTRGIFSGTFEGIMNADKSNIIGTTTDKIQNIYKPQTITPIITQIPEIVFLNNNFDTQETPETLTTTSYVKINNVQKLDGEKSILKYRISGILTRPTQYAVS